MSDDTQVAEQDTTTIEDGFNTAVATAANPPKPEGVKPDPKAKKDDGQQPVKVKDEEQPPAPEKKAEEKKTDKPPAKKDEKPKDEAKPASAAERLAARAKEIETAPADDPAKIAAEKAAKEAADKKAKDEADAKRVADEAKAKEDRERAARESATAPDLKLDDAEMDGLKVNINGEDMTIKDAIGIMPETVAIAKAIAQALVGKVGAALKGQPKSDGKPDETVAALRQEVENLRIERANTRFFDDVQNGFEDKEGNAIKGHADAKTIARSKPFNEWLGKQSKGVQAMTESLDPLDAITVLDAYKEFAAKSGKPVADAKPNTERERRNARLRDAADGSPSPAKVREREDEDSETDKDDGFNEGLKKK